jgi:hypothetical protein
MNRELTPAEKSAIRTCIRHYIDMIRKLRESADVTEDLKDEFERSLYSPVCLLSAAEDREEHPTHFCHVCSLGDRHKADGSAPSLEVLSAYQTAAEHYLASDAIAAGDNELTSALMDVIKAHWSFLHKHRLKDATV